MYEVIEEHYPICKVKKAKEILKNWNDEVSKFID